MSSTMLNEQVKQVMCRTSSPLIQDGFWLAVSPYTTHLVARRVKPMISFAIVIAVVYITTLQDTADIIYISIIIITVYATNGRNPE